MNLKIYTWRQVEITLQRNKTYVAWTKQFTEQYFQQQMCIFIKRKTEINNVTLFPKILSFYLRNKWGMQLNI